MITDKSELICERLREWANQRGLDAEFSFRTQTDEVVFYFDFKRPEEQLRYGEEVDEEFDRIFDQVNALV